jgi:VWFA-related protein
VDAWAIVASTFLLVGPPANGDQEAEISVDVNLVVLHVTVRDQHGGFLSDLQQSNFQVYENGVPQRIKLFSHEDVPIAAGLVVDHSGSMRPKLAEVSAAVRTFAEASNPDDQMFAVNFNEHIEPGLPDSIRFSADPNVLEQAVQRTPAGGETALYDAIAAALQQLRASSRDKKVLLVISDGGDNASIHKLPEVLKMAAESNAIIYTVGIFDDNDTDRNPRVLRRLAESTGGIAFFPKQVNEVVGICARIASDIRHQYTIGYTPANPARNGEYRTIRVVASVPQHGKLSVRTRSGYVAGDRR